MYALMDVKMAQLRERLLASLAFVGLLTSVQAVMNLEVLSLHKRLAACGAHMILRLRCFRGFLLWLGWYRL